MQLIHYSDDIYATGDDIAHAVIEYAKALALAETSATVGIPFRRDDGSIGHLELLIGPASQIVLESTEEPADELLDDEVVATIRQRTLDLVPARAAQLDLDDQAEARPVAPEDH
jgi:hypothetical protein